MRNVIKIVAILLLTSSYKTNNEKQVLETFFHKTRFDTGVIEDLPLYNNLKDLATSNADTIFKFRKNEEPPYTFLYNHSTKEILNVEHKYALPEFLTPKFLKVFEQLGAKGGNFTMYNDSSIEIGIGGMYDEKTDFESGHQLVWKSKFSYGPESLIKDTVIAPGWTYYISVGKRHNGAW